MAKLTIDAAVLLPEAELENRSQACIERSDVRIRRAQEEGRDLTGREHELTQADRDELVVIRDAREIRSARREQGEAIEARSTAIANEIGRLTGGANEPFRPGLLVSDRNLELHARALRDGQPYGCIEVETRARVTAAGDLGAKGDWHPGQPNEPRHLISFAQIPVSELTGRRAELPAYTGPTAGAGADESTASAEFDSINPVALTALRYGAWTLVSALANVVDDLRGVNMMHGWQIARSLDLLAVGAIQTAASTPVAVVVDLETQVRQAILQVAANTYSDETQLVIVGTPADLSLLTGTTPANASDLGSTPVRFNGAALYPTIAATAAQVTIFAPNAFRVFQSKLQSATIIDPTDGSNKFGSWMHSTGVGQQITGAAVAVDTVP